MLVGLAHVVRRLSGGILADGMLVLVPTHGPISTAILLLLLLLLLALLALLLALPQPNGQIVSSSRQRRLHLVGVADAVLDRHLCAY